MPSRRWLNEIAIVAAIFYLLIDAYDRNLTARTVILGLILLGFIAEELYRNWGRS